MSKLPIPRNAVVYDVMSLNCWTNMIHEWAVAKGWATEDCPDDPDEVRRIVIEKLLLMHTEIAEATEALRDVNFRDPYFMDQLRCSFSTLDDRKPCGLASELIDTIIRVLQLCAVLGIDVEGEMELKMSYNLKRPFRHGGKNL